MAPRTILYTGKGGVGKTSVAAACARACAAAGHRTLVLSTDPAHSLSDVLGRPLGPEPTDLGGGLWGQQVSAQAELERHWSAVRAWLGQLLVGRGVERVAAEELTVPPGLDELFSLLQVKEHFERGEHDVVVVDCAPTGETLRLLSFPDVARWWLERVLPQQGRMLDAARPFARAVLDLSLPDEAVLDDVAALVRNLVAMHDILRDHERVSLRLVMNPDRMALDEARRTFTYLNLYGFLTDAVVVNRVLGEDTGPFFAAWRERQARHLQDALDSFSPVPVLRAPWFGEEVLGAGMLDRLGAALFDGRDPAAMLHAAVSQRLEVGPSAAVWRVALPLARREEIRVRKVGHELVVRVGDVKRTVLLPPALADYRPAGAALADGALEVRFDGPSAD